MTDVPNFSNSFASKIPVFPLLGLFLLTLIAAYGIAYYYRNAYEVKHNIRAYLFYALPHLAFGFIFHMNWIFILGLYLMGAIVLMFRNQHYFDH